MTAKIKLNAASGGGSFSLQAPSSSANNRVITLPDVADGTLLTSSSGVGITMADQWRLNTDLVMSQNTDTNITANWERVDSDGFGQLGTGMTESSGVFTFPSTGIYIIRFHGIQYAGSSASSQNRIRITTTTDNSSYSTAASGFSSNYAQYVSTSASCEFQFDVTNTSTHKVIFAYRTGGTGVKFVTDSQNNCTFVTFIRLGDT
tara:strand:+ start:120 stop:731 length:612 start_codon:yes stop_codon:yes gene_type:complete